MIILKTKVSYLYSRCIYQQLYSQMHQQVQVIQVHQPLHVVLVHPLGLELQWDQLLPAEVEIISEFLLVSH